jgi:hypothetical protein
MDFKNTIARLYFNISGWRTNRKILVIESDDWGSIRMPSHEVYELCLNEGYPVNLNSYERYDSLASKDDLELLFDLLASYRDKNGNHPVITANCVVANPDFTKIKNDDFLNYHFELITETFKNYPNHAHNFEMWQEGNLKGVFHPQFHAREHLNVSKFMKALREKDADVLFGFRHRMPGCIRKGNKLNGNDFMESTYCDSEQDKTDKLNIFLEGLDVFEKLFGYKSLSIIPPNYTWSDDYNESISKKGVKYIQGIRKMREPVPYNKSFYNSRFLGMKYIQGQKALVRNVTFEPSFASTTALINKCLSEIDIAFRLKKPAIVCSHRINFVGFIDERNRDNNLKLLQDLLTRALHRWPDIEFMASDELGKIMDNENRINQ